MNGRLGLVLMSLTLASGCSEKTTLKGAPDAAEDTAAPLGSGGSGTGGDTVATSGVGGTTGVGGSSGLGGATSAPTGGSATGGASMGSGGASALGGASTGSGGRTAGTGGLSTGGQAGGTSPANDTPGQDPYERPAASGILITSSDGLNSTPLLLAADAKDGMFVTGSTRNPKAMGLTAFDPGVVSEAFAARFDAGGKLVWSVPLKTCGVPADIAAGADDSVFVLCPYAPDQTTLMPSTCFATASVEKLSGTDGKVIFEASVNVPATPADGYMCPYGLGVDAQGRSYVGGAYGANEPAQRPILSAVTAAGKQDWTLIAEGPAFDPMVPNTPSAYITDVDVDSNGNVLFVGGFNMWIKWGTTQLTSQAVVVESSTYNGFFARVPADGTGPTAWRLGGTVFDITSSVARAADGGFVLGGWASGSSSIGGKTVSASQDGSAFVARVDSQGQATWAQAIPGKGIADHIALGPDGKAYVVGQFEKDEILYIYDPVAATLTSRKTQSGNATDNALRTQSVAVSTSGAVWLSGTFQGSINLGTGTLSTTTVAAFLIRLN